MNLEKRLIGTIAIVFGVIVILTLFNMPGLPKWGAWSILGVASGALSILHEKVVR